MYEIKNGILYKDGKKTFVLGESYYPSFHPYKYPVAPEGDRMGEMAKDLKGMAAAGFNHVRFAALGEIAYDADAEKVSIDAPFVEAMLNEANKNGLSASIRLQGFSVNLRNFTDVDMIDEYGNVPRFMWYDFVRSTLTHEGILEDNFVYARDLAAHFAAFENVIGYQIYNEPKYPQPKSQTFDYNPHAIRAFRAWLVERGILTEAEAKDYQPPHGRKEQTPRMWALWRVFAGENMRNFLNNAANGAKAGASLPTFTCLTADNFSKNNARKCLDVFGNAKGMELVGYTIYKHAWGMEYYSMCLEGDTFQCAAESEGKQAWCVELDSRTYMPPFVYNKGTYATIGSGVKGIVYYQWRGDCPVPGVPHPNSCGIVNYDGTKTDNFDNALAVNRYILSINELLVNAHRANEGIGLFYSLHAIAYSDALENSDYYPQKDKFLNTNLIYCTQLYTDLRKAGYTVTITDAAHLAENRAGIKTLFVPSVAALSNTEKQALDAFVKAGGTLYENVPELSGGFRLYVKREKTYKEQQFDPIFTAEDLPALTGVKPIAVSRTPNLGVQVLQGEDYTLLVLTNFSPLEKRMDASVQVNIPFANAQFTAIDGAREVQVNGNELTVKDIADGGILILRG